MSSSYSYCRKSLRPPPHPGTALMTIPIVMTIPILVTILVMTLLVMMTHVLTNRVLTIPGFARRAARAPTPPIRMTANDIVQISSRSLLRHVRQTRALLDRRQLADVPRVSRARPDGG